MALKVTQDYDSGRFARPPAGPARQAPHVVLRGSGDTFYRSEYKVSPESTLARTRAAHGNHARAAWRAEALARGPRPARVAHHNIGVTRRCDRGP